MLETIKNAWKIPELRKKILFTLLCLLVFRLGSAVPVPFISDGALKAFFANGEYSNTILSFMNVMSGGAFEMANIFALSIQPYINASIIMQLLAIAIPALERMSKEGGEEGKRKLASITRYVTIAIALLQGFAYYTMLSSNGIVDAEGLNPTFVAFVIVATFTAGSAFIMWLGEQITEKGIGNGISMILFVSIVSRVFPAMWSMYQNDIGLLVAIAIIVVFLAVIAFIVFFDSAERRLSVQYAKRVVGRKMYGGRSTHLPIKVNMSGVMPIIFASTISTFPATLAAFFPPEKGGFWYWMQENVFSPDSWVYAVLYLLLIFGFSYFYAAIQYNPTEIANNLKNNGGFIPGFRPGKPTADFISKVMKKITLFGAFFLGVVAILPIITGKIIDVGNLAIGGTSVLIVVGVALETVKQLESQMMMRNYKGFLE